MNEKSVENNLSKVPEVTLLFWVMKIAATTVGETGGDMVSMSMNLGYLLSTAIFAVIFIVAVIIQIKAKAFHPYIYWFTIIATTTVGTTMADFCDRSLGRRLRGRFLDPFHPTDGLVIHLVQDPGHGGRGFGLRAEIRDVLLGDHHVLPDPGHGLGGLDGRFAREWATWAGRPYS